MVLIYIMNNPLSNIDLEKMLKELDGHGVNIEEMDNINKNSKIEDVFKNRGHVILFVKYPKEEVGHWVSLVRGGKDGKRYIFLDSLGKPIKHYNKELLNLLLKNGNVLENGKKYQGDESAVCGRYAYLISGINKLTKGEQTEDFFKYIMNLKPKGMSYDEWVLELTRD